MGPGEQTPQSVPPRRPPLPRRQFSIDGVSNAPYRRPVGSVGNGRPPVLGRTSLQPAASAWSDVQPTQAQPTQVAPVANFQPLPQPSQPVNAPVMSVQPVAAAPNPMVAAQSFQPPLLAVQPTVPAPTATEQALPAIRPYAETAAGQAELEAEAEEPEKPKKKRKLKLRLPHPHFRATFVIIPLLVAVLAGAIGGGTYAFLQYRAAQNDPVKIFSSALKNAFQTSHLQTQTTTGRATKTVAYDLTSMTQPIVSVQSSQMVGSQSVQRNGYGTTVNTYVSYTKLPLNTPSAITSVAQNAWVQLRDNSTAATGISNALGSLPDPRYQVFGPLLFDNASSSDQKQLVSFITNHNIYQFKAAAMTHGTYSGAPALDYPVSINTSYLKILNQSMAAMAGFTPNDVQVAVDQLSGLSTATLYVAPKTHQFMGMTYTQNGQNTTIQYSYNPPTIPNEPETKLTWPEFAPTEYALEAQLSNSLTPTERDTVRTQDLAAVHTALAAYEATNGFYPTLANMNDENWVAQNLPGLDPEVLRDPAATSLTLLDTPKAGSYAYQPSPDSHSGSCVNAGTDPCTHYSFTAILSTNRSSTVIDP
jgi:hypothetical protein